MFKHLYKTAFIALLAVLSFQESFAQCSVKTDLQVSATSPICYGGLSTVTIKNSEIGVGYQSTVGDVAVGSLNMGTGNTLSFSISGLSTGVNTISILALAPGCTGVYLTQKITIEVNSPAVYSFSVSGDTICSSSTIAQLTIKGSNPTVQYQMYLGVEKLLDPFNGNAGTNTTVKNIPTSLLSIGANTITVKATVNSTCHALVLSMNATILVNPPPVYPTPILIGDTVTLPTSTARIRIINPILRQTYRAFKEAMQVGNSVIGFGNEVEILIPVGGTNGLKAGAHNINIQSNALGCGYVPLLQSTTILVKPEIITSIEDKQITSNFAVYPNPFNSEITITYKLKGQLKMQITDAIGNIVHQESISNAQDLKLNPDLKSGLYFLQMESEGLRETVKLIKL